MSNKFLHTLYNTIYVESSLRGSAHSDITIKIRSAVLLRLESSTSLSSDINLRQSRSRGCRYNVCIYTQSIHMYRIKVRLQ